MPDQYFDGGLSAISAAPWTADFDDATAVFVACELDDIIEQGLVLPSEEAATAAFADGTNGIAGARTVLAIPVRNHGSNFVTQFSSNTRWVFRIEQLDGTAYLVGADRGMQVRVEDRRGQAFGSFPHVLITGEHTRGTTGSSFSTPAA